MLNTFLESLLSRLKSAFDLEHPGSLPGEVVIVLITISFMLTFFYLLWRIVWFSWLLYGFSLAYRNIRYMGVSVQSRERSRAFGIRQNGKLAGYGLIGLCRSGFKIGPLFAAPLSLPKRFSARSKARFLKAH
ncbi:MAG TPA: hypothetical protein DEB17_01895 [Chlorobaculum sp.]|uniref:YitH/HolE acetyltransferase (GNAT) domain-containing protein n=1 Tax=Chlorobaculum tepidum (strain ATCC 49652 / DSM 12025 / NBRC 103806 / TLS) TaxID=194439 RepID=Q8KDI8_CHLTE|nr:hypothetical protein [Chlorobaculum tepidum]AAM72295.1 hypothetical protein CT1062 [Chlorobaculum tepidum TLS]HBU22751.1 hypothetical protein [Chlorobaculum sp.]